MRRYRSSPHGGQSLVEFALIVPLLIALTFILVELGVVFSTYVGLTNSAREMARAGVIYQYPDPASLNETASCAYACQQKKVDDGRAALMNQVLADTLNPIVDGSKLAPTITYQPATSSTLFRYGDKMTVKLEYTHPLFFKLFGTQTLKITSSSQMRLEPGGR